MCGRTALVASPDDLREFFGLGEQGADGSQTAPLAHYNIPPSRPLAIVRVEDTPLGRRRRLDSLAWGFVPSWANTSTLPRRLLPLPLARSESAATSSAFRDAVRRRRCLVAVTGFFEWKKHAAGASEPYYVKRTDGALFALGGIWDRRVTREGEVLESCAILTQPARAPVDAIHDRMPLVLPPDAWDAWLDPDITDAAAVAELLAPRSPELAAHPVGPRVNDPRNDDPGCLAPAAPRPPQQTVF
jgi:putative SOS response-associated peptidase YedK